MRSLDQLLVRELRDLYATEEALVPALANMSGRATNPELKRALDHHCLQTQGQLDRLTRVFRAVGARPKRGDATPVLGVIAEAERLLLQSYHTLSEAKNWYHRTLGNAVLQDLARLYRSWGEQAKAERTEALLKSRS